jgi:tRNA-splicing ligase RtcB (3'-phosphate/5'-hydroxy nucleic acid ligase)
VDSVPKRQSEGLWRFWHELDWPRDFDHIDQHGGLLADLNPAFEDWLGAPGLSRDAQIGSIGGGNHFVEIQRIERIYDRSIAHAWGLREGMVTVMIHTGSLSIGSQSAALIRDVLQRAHPRAFPKPHNGLFVLPIGDSKLESIFWNALGNAANFAFANRAILALMTWQALEIIAETDYPLLYDAPHNLVWRDHDTWIHRKGATPARGLEAMQDTPFAYTGEPVLVPGSMGSSSFIMAGLGHSEALSSASHGAGRALSRGQASRGFDAEFAAFLESFRVVTPLDWRRVRADIKARKLEELKQEAPHAYKGILPVVQTLEGAGLAKRVAEVKPLMTVKG